MKIGVLAALAIADLILGVVIVRSLTAAPPQAEPATAPRLPPPRSAAPTAAPAERPAEVAAILARPLFDPTRRPAPAGQPAPGPQSEPVATLPRMMAILIDGANRRAIFEGKDGKPLVLSEGGHVGPFTIVRIEPQQVVVDGPEGTRVVHTKFDLNAPPVMPLLPSGMLAPVAPPPSGAVTPNFFPQPPRFGR